MRLNYQRALELYDVFIAKPSYTRSRAGPLRRKMTKEEMEAYMTAVYGPQTAKAESVARSMFSLEDVPNDFYLEQERVKAQFNEVRNKSRSLRGKLKEEFDGERVLKKAYDHGADLAAFTRYFDPYYGKTMCMLVFALDMNEFFKVVKLPHPKFLGLGFLKNVKIQDITNKVCDELLSEGIFCEPVPSGTYYSLDSLEFNQIRLAEMAFGGEIGKHYVLMLEKFGPRFRCGYVILPENQKMEIRPPKPVSLCKGYKGECDICVKACPSGALVEDNVLTCSKYFLAHNHCSVCVQVCPVPKAIDIPK